MDSPIQLQQLGQDDPRRPSPKEQDRAARFESNQVHPMESTCRWLNQGCLLPGQVLKRKDLFGLDRNIFGLPTSDIDAMREKVLTEQWLITPTVEAVAAQFSIVTDHSLAHLHALYSRTNADHLSSKFVTRNKREFGEELPLVDVQIGSTNTTGAHTNEHFIGSYLRHWYLSRAKLLWGIVDNRFHIGLSYQLGGHLSRVHALYYTLPENSEGVFLPCSDLA